MPDPTVEEAHHAIDRARSLRAKIHALYAEGKIGVDDTADVIQKTYEAEGAGQAALFLIEHAED